MDRIKLKSEIDKKDFYLEYKRITANNIKLLNTRIEYLTKEIDDKKKQLSTNKKEIKKHLNIDLDKYQEYVHCKFNESYALYHIAYERICKMSTGKTSGNEYKVGLAKSITAYTKLLDNLENAKHKLKCYEAADKVGKREFNKRLATYYNKVVEKVMHGQAYNFSNNIGKFYIEFISLNKGSIGSKINFAATNKRKKELLAAGVELYSEVKAAWYKARNIKYEGVDYRVYNTSDKTFVYRFTGYGGRRKSYMYRPYNHRANSQGTYEDYYLKYDKNFDKIMAARELGIYNKVGILKKFFPHLLINYQHDECK